MKKAFALVCCSIVVAAAHADVGQRHFENTGGFSFQAPKGWQLREFPGMKYRIALGPAANSFSPNINIVDEAFSGPLKSYVDANRSTLERMSIQLTVLKREPFATASGMKGERMVITSLQQTSLLRQTFYFLPSATAVSLRTPASISTSGSGLFILEASGGYHNCVRQPQFDLAFESVN